MSAVGAMRGVVFVVGCTVVVTTLWARTPGGYRGRTTGRGGYGGRGGDDKDKEDFKLPDDQRLLKLHESFVRDAEKLASEYEKTNQFDKARNCYEEILRLVPVYSNAQTALDKVKGKQYSAEKKTIDILANKGWQDSGVVVAAGKPIIIRADGTWTFRMTHELSADGVEIPEELQAFRLGSLIGMIDDGSGTSAGTSNSRERHHDRDHSDAPKEGGPFLIGSNYEFTAEKTGKLMLRMYDADPTDNQGKVSVTIAGSFYHPTKK